MGILDGVNGMAICKLLPKVNAKRAMGNVGVVTGQAAEDTRVKSGSNFKGRTRWQLLKVLKLRAEANMGSIANLEKDMGNGMARVRKHGGGPRGKLLARAITA